MKKEKIYNIVIACICFVLWFMPIERFNYAYVFTLRSFFEFARTGWLFTLECLGELLTVTFGIITIVLIIVNIYVHKLSTKIIATASSLVYVLIWSIRLFAKFQSRIPIYESFISGSHTLWLILYFVLLLAILVLTALQYLQYLPVRRPTKAERLQAQVDDLQKQIDELKKGE